MGEHSFNDGEEIQNFKNFQKYQSFDNGILDIETINNEITGHGNMDTETTRNRSVDTETAGNTVPDSGSFDPEVRDTYYNFDQAIVPGTIDSRSFTHTEPDWQRVQEEASSVNYVDAVDSWNDGGESKPQNFFHVLLAFLVSIIAAVVMAVINIMVYNIEYISTIQFMLSIFPSVLLFTVFYNMTHKRKMKVREGVFLIIFNVILSYIMFVTVMAHNLQKEFSMISFWDAWKLVHVMKDIVEVQHLYYLHFGLIFVLPGVMGIIFGCLGIKGLLDEGTGRRRRY